MTRQGVSNRVRWVVVLVVLTGGLIALKLLFEDRVRMLPVQRVDFEIGWDAPSAAWGLLFFLVVIASGIFLVLRSRRR